MSDETKKKKSGAVVSAFAFLVVFTAVFSLGVMVGKQYIPPDEAAPSESSPGVLEKLFSFLPGNQAPEPEPEKPAPAAEETPSAQPTPPETAYAEKEPAPAPKPPSIISPADKYTIQISSFLNRKVAVRTVRFYRDKGYPAFIKEYSPSEITTFYRVRIGTFPSKEEARKYGEEIKAKDADFKFYITLND